ncbi:DUF3336 domain-containing protein [Spongiibacter sp. UBA1325]|jgi:NTE family protein|uniref:DUF3336 domain-containing protein n=1 Tax=Spongiibacter sp. UBA1325 TaxID=1947543 RepID=UPI00257C9641|nr:DUF3336 domain-containing protein [Spongiibacter sp. UBA1325]|tara:strand:- start:20611 stop:22098 length:1488 start_codon:yes stop_codon:yes gene_type:complete
MPQNKLNLNGLYKQLRKASNYEEWRELAQALDKLQGLDTWRQVEQTRLYDYRSTRNRLLLLREKRTINDDRGLLFALNEGVHGNMGGMGAPVLYQRALFGTKQLIEDYINEIADSLNYLASNQTSDITSEQKQEFFQRAHQCFGKTALMLSGSGTLLYFHLGVVKALWEQNLLPKILCGASGGGLISALVGTHSQEELAKIFDPDYIRFEVEHGSSILGKLALLGPPTISPDAVRKLYSRLIPELSFAEAKSLTGYDINISVAPAEKHQTSRLLNALASPNVLITDSVLASCAFPGFFPPVSLRAKDEQGNIQPYLKDRVWIDGSISDDMPIKRITRLFGVNHFIVSQTNPAALPFLNQKTDSGPSGIIRQALKNTSREWLLAGNKLLNHPINKRSTINRVSTMLGQAMSQTYTGHINILPPNRFHNPLKLLSGRNTEEIMSLIKAGEQATWPYIEQIRIQTKISRVLSDIMKKRDFTTAPSSPSLEERINIHAN